MSNPFNCRHKLFFQLNRTTANRLFLSSQLNSPTDRYNVLLQVMVAPILTFCPQPKLSFHPPTDSNYNTPSNKKRTFVPAPRWNDQCDKVIAEQKTATVTFRRLLDYKSYTSLHKIEAETRRTLNSARRTAFKSFRESIDRMTPIST